MKKFNLRKYWIDVYTYYSDKSVDDFRKQLLLFLEQTQASKNFYKTNVTGQVLSDTSFELQPKWELGYSLYNRGKPSTYLYGEIFPFGQATKIVFSVTPFPFALINAAICLLFGIAAFFNLLTEEFNLFNFMLTILFLIVFPALILSISLYFKRKLKSNFVRLFDLKQTMFDKPEVCS